MNFIMMSLNHNFIEINPKLVSLNTKIRFNTAIYGIRSQYWCAGECVKAPYHPYWLQIRLKTL